MKRSFAALAFALLLPACGGNLSSAPAVGNAITPALPIAGALGTQTVFWTSISPPGAPAVQFTNVPLRKSSRVTTIYANEKNELGYATAMRVDAAGRLWILAPGPSRSNPAAVYVFDLPLTQSSTPRYTFILQGSTVLPYHLAFDPSGNLWVSSQYDNAVFEYTGPFNQSGKLSPAATLTDGIASPSGLAFDENGNLYVANSLSDTKNSIAVFTAPIVNRHSYFLNGLRAPGGLIFDAAGNLYASDNYTSISAVVRYNSDHLKAGDHPNIVDRTGLHEILEADFVLTAAGDLYLSNCGTFPSIYWYATSKKPFSAKLAPSLNYANHHSTECIWGIAIR